MTREAKAGVVVAGSFVVLLGVVIVSKWRGTDSLPETANVTTVTPEVDKLQTASIPSSAPLPLHTGIVQAAAANDAGKPGLSPSDVFSVPLPVQPNVNAPMPEAVFGAVNDAAKQEQDEILRKLNESKRTVNPVPNPALSVPPAEPIRVAAPTQLAQATPPAPPVGLPPAPPVVPMPEAPGFPLPEVKGPAAPPAAVELPSPVASPVPAAPEPTPVPVPVPVPAAIPVPETKAPIPSPVPAVLPSEPKAAAPEPKAPAPEPKAAAPEPKATFAPLGEKAPAPAPAPAPEPAPAPLGDTAKPSLGLGSPAPTPSPTPTNVPPLGGKSVVPVVNETPKDEPPPLGSPKRELPMIGGAAQAAPRPLVKTHEEEMHRVTAEETSFDALSRRLYQSDKYGRALLAYNRKHLMAKPSVRQEPPQLQPGDVIFYPPVGILEIEYADQMQAATTPTPSPTPMATPTPTATPTSATGIAIGTPRPLGTTAATRAPAVAPPTTDKVKHFVVHGQGQMMLEIARRTLGDANRWPEVYRLNPNLQPQFPIPAGTELRLPMSAQTP